MLALRRPRNLAAVVLPFGGIGLFAVLVGDPAAVLLALSPSPLIGPSLARAIGAREETVGALMTGTLVLSFPLLLTALPGVSSSVYAGLGASYVGVTIGGMLPRFRDAVLPVTDGARYAALAILLGSLAIAGASLLDLRAFVIAAAALAIGALCAAIGALPFGGDPLAAAIGGGLRDPGVSVALAIASGLAGAGSVPLAYAVLVVLAVALGKLVVRRQP